MSRISLSDFTLAVAPKCVENGKKYRAYFFGSPSAPKMSEIDRGQ